MKSILFYRNHKYQKVKQKNLMEVLHREIPNQSLELILIPYLSGEGNIYIPVRPSRDLLFQYATIQMITTVHMIDFDMNHVDGYPNHGEEQRYDDLISFINALFYYYKLHGFNMIMEGVEESYPMDISILAMDYVKITTYNRKNEILFQSEEHNPRLAKFYEKGFTQYDFSELVNIYEYSYEGIDAFIFPLKELRRDPNAYYAFEFHSNHRWKSDGREESRDQIALVHMLYFNCYCTVDQEEVDFFQKAPALEVNLATLKRDTSLIEEDDMKKISYWIENWYSVDAYRSIRETIKTGMNEISYYHSYMYSVTYLDEYLSFLFFGDILGFYTRYILYYAVFEQHGSIDDYHSIISIGNCGTGDKDVMLDYMMLQHQSLYNFLINFLERE